MTTLRRKKPKPGRVLKRAAALFALAAGAVFAFSPVAAPAQTPAEVRRLNEALERRIGAAKQDELRKTESPDAPRVTDKAVSTSLDVERGDVLSVDGRRYRLWGVVAPAHNEYGGFTSAQELKRLLGLGRTTCVSTGHVENGLPLARCRVDGRDLAALMAAGGYVRDCPRWSRGTYASIERQAVSIVGGGFDLPPECLED